MEGSSFERANYDLERIHYNPEDVPSPDTEEYQAAMRQAQEIFKYRDIAQKLWRGEIDVSEALRRIARRKKEGAILHAFFYLEYEDEKKRTASH